MTDSLLILMQPPAQFLVVSFKQRLGPRLVPGSLVCGGSIKIRFENFWSRPLEVGCRAFVLAKLELRPAQPIPRFLVLGSASCNRGEQRPGLTITTFLKLFNSSSQRIA